MKEMVEDSIVVTKVITTVYNKGDSVSYETFSTPERGSASINDCGYSLTDDKKTDEGFKASEVACVAGISASVSGALGTVAYMATGNILGSSLLAGLCFFAIPLSVAGCVGVVEIGKIGMVKAPF